MQEALIEAILESNVPAVQQMLQEGTELNIVDVYGFTPLVEAVIVNSFEIVNLLLQSGAAVDYPDSTGRTPLHWATDNNQLSICKLLLEHGANPNAYTDAGQPILVLPYLRRQQNLKLLLYKNKAKLSLAQDFIRVKLIGHRYELIGEADIFCSVNKEFIAIDYEGFIIEFVIEVIGHSIELYCKHFVARQFSNQLRYLKKIRNAFKRASALLQYHHYMVDRAQSSEQIDALLSSDYLLLPVAAEGHAITLVYYNGILVRCNRGESSRDKETITFFKIGLKERWTKTFIKSLLYDRHPLTFFTEDIDKILALRYIQGIPLRSQIAGNCSWANIEASVLASVFLLGSQTEVSLLNKSMRLYEHWLQWDRSRALEECLQTFVDASSERKVTYAMVLTAVLFQTCNHGNEKELKIAKKIFALLINSEYAYVVKNYLKIYWADSQTEEGHNLMQLLRLNGYNLEC